MSFLLKEDGDKILKEDGGGLLLETGVVTAEVSPLVVHLSLPAVALSLIETADVIQPSAVGISKPKFTYLIESIDGTFRYATENWEFDEISREVNGSMSVRIRTDQLTTDIARAITDLMNKVTIRVSTENTGSLGIPYFCGYIPNRNLNLTAENQSVDIMVFGFAGRLADIPYRTGTTVAIDKTGGITASNLAKDVIDKVIALDANFPVNYTTTSVESSVDTVKDIFKLSSALDALNRAVLMAYDASRIWFWRILGDNIFTFKKASTTPDHSLVYGKHVLSFPQFSEDLMQAKNEIMVVYNSGANIKRVADTASIALYGLRSLVVNENNVPDATTATEVGNAYLASLTPPIRTVTVQVASTYPIEFINPGDTCRINNLPPDIAALLTDNLFITKTVYRRDTVDLTLSIKPPFIQNKVQKIENKLNQQAVEDMGATTYS